MFSAVPPIADIPGVPLIRFGVVKEPVTLAHPTGFEIPGASLVSGCPSGTSLSKSSGAHREPTTYSRIPLVGRPECLIMKARNWIILVVLLGMLAGAVLIGYD